MGWLSVKHQGLDLSSGLDIRVVSSNLTLSSTLGMEPTLKNEWMSECMS